MGEQEEKVGEQEEKVGEQGFFSSIFMFKKSCKTIK